MGKRTGLFAGLAFVFSALLAISACGPIYSTRYNYTPPPTMEGRMCANQCSQINQLCKQNCKLERQNCEARIHAEAVRDYDRYVRERERENKPIEKSVSDFDKPYYCDSVSSCDSSCDDSFRGCYQTCGGTVTATTVCTSFCDDVPEENQIQGQGGGGSP